MGIGSLYYFAGSLLLASWCCWSHYEGFDGAFHRPGKSRKKAERQAQAQADALSKDLRESRDRHHSRHRDDDDPPARHPRRRYDSRSERSGRRRSQSRSTVSSSGQGSAIRSDYSHHGPEKRVQPTPYSDYVPEHFILKPNARGAVAPLHPVHGTQHDSHRRTPKDFDIPDPKHPGKTVRQSHPQAFNHLFGADDDQAKGGAGDAF
ncbi:hypothetical protein CKM354_001063000 [Cercospora kikuchii]|uniref:Uncharacterized protein n=1 Tax=Cercospora kikuchii TaxID=84275 RepID=A0A9P3CTY3_9PEZI|nr:uncharacterized protein CKM354_001063000 [Cercospora kikuchii]GIZ47542.1 hypothetical protein CKM354_001063000 [Cercospora kikuchii]